MPIKDPVERSVVLFDQDYSCSQSLLLAYAPRLGIDASMAARIAAPFAGGMGRLGWTCGAVSGALMVIGLQFDHDSPYDEEAKQQLYRRVREFITRFKERYGTILCRELVGHDISTPEGLDRARAEGVFDDRCPNFVRDAAEIVGEILDWD
jgi:C_GCAxxG_C_C family probable redox protein